MKSFFFSKSLFKKSLKHPNAGGQIGRAWSWEQRLALVPQLPQQVVLPWTKPSTGKGWTDGVSQLSQVLKCIGGNRCGVVAGSSLGQVRKLHKS